MRVVVAPDKFKGSLSAAEAAEAIGRGLRAAGADIDLAPIAGGEGMQRIARIDASGLDPRWSAVEVIVAADVMSPLTGPEGAARVYGPQKGATPEQIGHLERGLEALGARIEGDLGVAVLDVAGAGGGGGGGGGVLGVGAQLARGGGVVLHEDRVAPRLKGAELVGSR